MTPQRRLAILGVPLLLVVCAWLWPRSAPPWIEAPSGSDRRESIAPLAREDVPDPRAATAVVPRAAATPAQERRSLTPRAFEASIAGQVVREDDHGPLHGASVVLAAAHDPAAVRTTLTDQDGRYLFDRVRAGSHTLRAHTAEGTESPAVRVLFLGDSGPLRAPTLYVGARTLVFGRVVAPDGRRLDPPAAIYALPAMDSESMGRRGPGPWIAESDVDGSYSSGRAIPIDRRGGFVLAVAGGAFGFTAHGPLHPSQDTLEVDVELGDSAGFALRVRDEEGRPVPDALVKLAAGFEPLRSAVLLGPDRATSDPILRELLWRRTDGEGVAHYPALPVGNGFGYQAVVTAEGRPRSGPHAVSGPGIVEVALDPALLAREIRGRVRDPSGTPVGGATIRVEDGFDTEFQADSDGSFRYPIPDSRVAQPARFDFVAGEFCETSAVFWPGSSAPEDFDLVLRAGGRLAGRVLDEGGQPVAGMAVMAWVPGRPDLSAHRATTRSDGDFELRCVGDDPVLVRVLSGYDPLAHVFRPQVEVLAARGAELVLTMPALETRPQVVRFVGLDPEGRAVPVQVARLVPRPTGNGDTGAVPWPRISVRVDHVLVSELHPADWDLRIEDVQGRVGHLAIERTQFSLPSVVHVPLGIEVEQALGTRSSR